MTGTPAAATESRLRGIATVLSAVVLTVSVVGAMRISAHGYVGAALSHTIVGAVDLESPAMRAGLRPRDRIIAMDGVAAERVPHFAHVFRSSDPGTRHALRIQRGAEIHDVVLAWDVPPPREILWRLTLAAVGILCLALGAWSVWRRPGALTFLFFLNLTALAWLLREPIPTRAPLVITIDAVAGDVAQLLWPAWLVHFFLLFPEPRRWLVRRPRLLLLPYAGPVALLAVALVAEWREFRGTPLPDASLRLLEAAGGALLLLAFVGSLALFANAFLVARGVMARRRLRVALLGTAVGVVPAGLISLVLALAPGLSVPGARYAALALLFVPLGFGYAIVRYQLLDTELIVRRGVAYSIVTALLVAVYAAMVWGVGSLVRDVLGGSSGMFAVLAFLVVALFAAPVQGRVQALVDRAFFRGRYDYAATMHDVSRALATLMEPSKLAGLVVSRIADALQPDEVALYAPAGPDDHSLLAVARWPEDGVRFPSGLPAALAAAIAAHGEPLPLEQPHVPLPATMTDDDRMTTLRLHAAVLVPCVAEGHAPAVLVLGPRRSGAWYTQDDLTLLATVGEQVGIALANARLSESRVEAARLERELAVAREVQRRLLPTRTPLLSGYAVAGESLQAEAVGGDWFDYVPLGEDAVGFVVADVSGHGVPAALLLASLVPHVRVEARRGVDPPDVLAALSRHVAAMDQLGRFVSFTYAVLNMRDGLLRTANAGLVPPLLLRANGSIERMESSGPPLGVEFTGRYTCRETRLLPGDVLLLHTDGITEQRRDDAFYGEERLTAVMRALRAHGAAAIRDGVLRDLRQFSGGVTDDDTTVIVVERTAPRSADELTSSRPPERAVSAG